MGVKRGITGAPPSTLERLMRDALVFPVYDGGNMGVRHRQLHALLREPDSTPSGPPRTAATEP
jgi:hypothetical protein